MSQRAQEDCAEEDRDNGDEIDVQLHDADASVGQQKPRAKKKRGGGRIPKSIDAEKDRDNGGVNNEELHDADASVGQLQPPKKKGGGRKAKAKASKPGAKAAPKASLKAAAPKASPDGGLDRMVTRNKGSRKPIVDESSSEDDGVSSLDLNSGSNSESEGALGEEGVGPNPMDRFDQILPLNPHHFVFVEEYQKHPPDLEIWMAMWVSRKGKAFVDQNQLILKALYKACSYLDCYFFGIGLRPDETLIMPHHQDFHVSSVHILVWLRSSRVLQAGFWAVFEIDACNDLLACTRDLFFVLCFAALEAKEWRLA
jgi:hypothetical protein